MEINMITGIVIAAIAIASSLVGLAIPVVGLIRSCKNSKN